MNQSGVSTYGAAVSGQVIATLAGVQAVLPAHRRRVCVLSHRCALLSAEIGLANLQKLGVMTRRSIQLAVHIGNLLKHCVSVRVSRCSLAANVLRRPNAANVRGCRNAPTSVSAQTCL
jgi:hypothetical protein